jgi:putative oxidoreductase
VQRLFSTFANGWPGAGLLLQRTLTAILLLRLGVVELYGAPFSPSMLPQLIGSLAGILLLAGLWTPIVGALIAGLGLWAVVTGTGDLWISVILVTLGGTIAMIGPGAWSLDARLFGRKHFATSKRRPSGT